MSNTNKKTNIIYLKNYSNRILRLFKILICAMGCGGVALFNACLLALKKP